MFVWTEPAKSRAVTEQHARARETMYRRELEQRAALLLRLGRGPAYVKARLAANLAWDFDLGPTSPKPIAPPLSQSEIDKIVDGVQRRQSLR